ncbi:MAG TPA: PAAR domain-containing protein, partial [Nannocystis sp.]
MGALSCIGQTLVKGLAVDYAIGQAFGVLAGIFAGVEAAPPPAEEKPACTVTHQIKHTSFWAALAGVVAGAVVAAAVSAAAVSLFAVSGGTALAVSIGAVVAAGPLIGGAASAATKFVDGMFPADDGPVITGSPNVFIAGKPVARAGSDTVACVKHSTPPLIAEGSETVLVNGWPAARFDDKTACGAALKQGCDSVLIGGPPIAMVPIENEFSLAERALLVAVEFLIPPSRCLTQGARKLVSGGAKLAGTAFKAAKSMIMNGIRKGPQLIKQGMSALKNQVARLKGALKGIWAGSCSKKCSPDPRKPSDKPGTNKPDLKSCKNDPIDTSTGAVVDYRVDFELGRSLRIQFVRSYDSGRETAGMLGRGWVDSFGEHLVLSYGGDLVELHCADGEVVPFDIASDTDRAFNRRFPHVTLIRERGGFVVHDLRDDRTRRFEVVGDRGRLVWSGDAHGNFVEFQYSGDRLVGVRLSDGLTLRLRHSEDPRKQLRTIFVERVDRAGARLVARYVVERGLLVEAESATGNHFFYQYDGDGRLARWADTAHTWVTYELQQIGQVGGLGKTEQIAGDIEAISGELDRRQSTLRIMRIRGHVRHGLPRPRMEGTPGAVAGGVVRVFQHLAVLRAPNDAAGGVVLPRQLARGVLGADEPSERIALEQNGLAVGLDADELPVLVVAVLDGLAGGVGTGHDVAGGIAGVAGDSSVVVDLAHDSSGGVTLENVVAAVGGAHAREQDVVGVVRELVAAALAVDEGALEVEGPEFGPLGVPVLVGDLDQVVLAVVREIALALIGVADRREAIPRVVEQLLAAIERITDLDETIERIVRVAVNVPEPIGLGDEAAGRIVLESSRRPVRPTDLDDLAPRVVRVIVRNPVRPERRGDPAARVTGVVPGLAEGVDDGDRSQIVVVEDLGGTAFPIDVTDRQAGHPVVRVTLGVPAGVGMGDELPVTVVLVPIDVAEGIDAANEVAQLVEVKLPGFSAYLHPVGEGLLLGVGRDGTEEGQILGMQLSLFDVSDIKNPKQ